MYLRSSFEHSSRPTFPPQPLLEFRFGSHHHITSPLSTPLPIPSHFRTAPYHSRTKSFSPYLASSKSLAPLYQKTPGVRTVCHPDRRPAPCAGRSGGIVATLQQHYKPSVPSRPCPQGPLPPSSLPLLVHSCCAKLFQGNRLT